MSNAVRFACPLILAAAAVVCTRAQSVLLEDDFERGWRNAMTHAYLPGWAGLNADYRPPTDGTLVPVSVEIDGDLFTVAVAGRRVGTFHAAGPISGRAGVFSWANSGMRAGRFTATRRGETLVAADWTPPTAWQRLRTTNAAGSQVPVSTNENLSWHFAGDGRYQETSNYFTRASASHPNIDFMGTSLVLADPAAADWIDYTVQARLLNRDNDGIGLITYARDAENFYRVVFCNELTQSGNWQAHERAPQGVSVQKVRDGEWIELYRTAPNNPDFIFTPGTPFDARVRVDTLFFGNRITITVINDPGGTAEVITLPEIIDRSQPLAGGAPGIFQWGSSDASWLSFGGGEPFVVAHDETSLVESPFVAGLAGWERNDRGTSRVGDPANWQVRLLPAPQLVETSDGRVADGDGANCVFTPYALVSTTPLASGTAGVLAEVGASDDDGFGLVFGYADNDNYLSVNLRAQAANLGFPAGVTVRQVVDGVATCLDPVSRPEVPPLAGVWLQKLTNGALENVGPEGLPDGSGRDGVEFQGPRIVSGAAAWADYTFEATLRTADHGALGLLFRFQDEENFYRLTFNSAQPREVGDPPVGVSVQKVRDGAWEELWRDERPTSAGGFVYDPTGAAGRSAFRVRLACAGDAFTLEIFEPDTAPATPFYTRSWDDPDAPLLSGAIGLHTYRHAANEFDALEIAFDDHVVMPLAPDSTRPAWRDATLLSPPLDFEGVGCGSVACVAGGPTSGIGLRPDIAGLGVRDNRWVSGTRFVVPDDPATPEVDPDFTRGTVDFAGPQAVAGDPAWSNYRVEAILKAIDDDGVGLVFRHQDAQNFYRLMFMSQAGNGAGAPPRGVSVQKCVDGVFEERLHSDAFVYRPGERWRVELIARGGAFTINVRQLDGDLDRDGASVYQFTLDDPAPLLTGAVGFTTWGMEAAVPAENGLGAGGLDWTAHFDEGAVLESITVSESRRPGDLNCDGVVDFADIDGFITALLSPASYGEKYPRCERVNGDLNADGAVTFFDIDPFVTALLAPEEFSIVVLPDTQVYSQSYPHIFAAQTQWIAANIDALNIKFVIHEGDMTNWNNEPQWENAKAAMRNLDGVVPYAMAPGNHDYGPGGNAADRTTFFNDFFPRSDYVGEPWFGGTFEPDKLDSSYHFFRAAGEDWLVLALEWGPRDQVVDWANSVLSQYPDHRTIIVTHAYMYSDETRYDHVTRPDQRWNPHSYGTANLPGGVNDGEELWQKLVRRHPNVVLVCNGHVLNDGAGRLSSTNDFGNTVHQVLTNYQMRREGGEGYLRIYTFSQDGRRLTATSYSPYLERYLDDPQHAFELPLNPPLRD